MNGQTECLHAHVFLSLPRVSLCVSEVKARPPAAGLSFYKLGLFVMHGGKKCDGFFVMLFHTNRSHTWPQKGMVSSVQE